jgi:transcription initiation factor TFIIIB Brf1 subunit/transcription initiation factor TFIIB
MKADLDNYTNNETILETASEILEKAKERNIHKRQGMDRTAEAVIKIAARQEQKLLEDPDKMEYFPGRGLDPGVRKIARYVDEYAPPYGPKLYLKTFEEQDFSDKIIYKAEEIINESSDTKELIGKSNTAGAAAAVYIASVLEDEYVPIKKIVEVSEVSEPTLRNSYVPMVEAIEKEDEFLQNHPHPSRTTWG